MDSLGPDYLSTGQLYEAVQQGQTEAWNRLLERMRPRLEAWAALRMGPLLKQRCQAEDVVQELLLKAHESIESFEPRGKRAFCAWLYSIGKNVIREWSRKYQAAKRAPARESEVHSGIHGTLTDPSLRAERAEEHALLLRVLAALPERYREIIRLRTFEHLTNGEAAAELAISVKNASVLHVRAMTALRERLPSTS